MNEKQQKATQAEIEQVLALVPAFEQCVTTESETHTEGAFLLTSVEQRLNTVSILALHGCVYFCGTRHNATVTYSNPSFNMTIRGYEPKRKSAGFVKNDPLANYTRLLHELQTQGCITFELRKTGHRSITRNKSELLTASEYATQTSNTARNLRGVRGAEKLNETVQAFALTLGIDFAQKFDVKWQALYADLHAAAVERDKQQALHNEASKQTATATKAVEALKALGLSRQDLATLLGLND